MGELKMSKDEFVGYEYKEVQTDASHAAFYMDCYENFGWETYENAMETRREVAGGRNNPHLNNPNKVMLRMKRNRKIINKMELTRLQRNFESCMDDIRKMEKSKSEMATIVSIIIGIVGTAFMAGAVFAITADTPKVILMIILAIPGFMGWLLPLFVYRKMIANKTKKMNPIIESKYDEIYEICGKGNRLLKL